MRILVEGDVVNLEAPLVAELAELGVIERGPESWEACFVGAVATRDDLILFAPKYASKEGRPCVEDARLAIAAVRRYLADVATDADAHREQDLRERWHRHRGTTLEYELYLTMERWFREHGVYRIYDPEVRRSVDHRAVHWSRTLRGSDAIHTNGGTLYDLPYVSRRQGQRTLVTSVQVSVLNALRRKYAHDERLPELPLDLAVIRDEDLRRRAAYWAKLVRMEMGTVFRAELLALLSNLLEYFDVRQDLEGPVRHRAVGTNAFHVVWERALRVVLGDAPSFAKKLSQPAWHFDNPPLTVRRGGQRPDIFLAFDDVLAVLDAKYYFPLPRSLCGWGDLVKQHFYAASFPASQAVQSGLLFPDSRVDLAERVGKVVMEATAGIDSRFSEIAVLRVNPGHVLRAYVRSAQSDELVRSVRGALTS